MNWTREELRSQNLHLAENHEMIRERGLMLLVGDLSLEEQEFMELSLEQYFVNIGGYTSTNVCYAFYGKKFHLEWELSNEVRIYKLKDHIKVKHKVMILGGILTKLNMMNKGERSWKIEIMLLRNGFRTHRYNRYHAAVSDQNKQDAENEDNMKVPILELKIY